MLHEQWQLLAWQQAVIDRNFHPTGVWEAFPESALERSVPACFEAAVDRFPKRTAVVNSQRALTELNAAARQIAHGLLARLGPGSEPVGHLLDHTADAVADEFLTVAT